MAFIRAKWRPYTLRLLMVLVVLGAWVFASTRESTSAVVLPTLPDVARRLVQLLGEGGTWSAVGVTLFESLVALAIAVMLGFVIGFIVSRTRYRAAVVQPLIGGLYMAPAIVFFPLYELWFGVGPEAKIAYAVANSILPIAFNTITAFRSIDEKHLRVGEAFGSSKLQTELFIKLPGSMPVVLAGVRIGAAACFISVILGETLAANRGIGSALTLASQILDSRSEFAYILIIIVLVGIVQVAIDHVLARGQRRARRRLQR